MHPTQWDTSVAAQHFFGGANHLLGRNRRSQRLCNQAHGWLTPRLEGSARGQRRFSPDLPGISIDDLGARRKFGRPLDLPIGALIGLMLHVHTSARFCSFRTDRRHLKFDFDGAGLLKL
jgi:hypothetical protein